MTIFILIATAMVGLSLALVLMPLLHRDSSVVAAAQASQSASLNLDVLRDHSRELDLDLHNGAIDTASHLAARSELERRVAEEVAPEHAHGSDTRQRWPAIALALALPLLSVALYATLGNPNGLRAASVHAAAAAGNVSGAQIEGMVGKLAARLKAQPDDADGWRMLAHSYETLRRFEPAADAYRHLLALEPNNVDAMVDYAVVLGMTLNGSLLGQPEQILAHALALDPNHVQALALSGSAALERGDYANAIKPWQRIQALVPADSEMARSIAASIAKAQQKADQAGER